MGKLEGKIAVITGGSSGMALASVKRFVEEGAYVFVTGRQADWPERDRRARRRGQSRRLSITAAKGEASRPIRSRSHIRHRSWMVWNRNPRISWRNHQ